MKEISPPFFISFYVTYHYFSLQGTITKYLEQNSTIPVNLKNRFKEFQLNTSILRINLLFNLLDSPYDSSCNGNGFKKKKNSSSSPPHQVASPCLSHATSNYLVYTPVHSRTKARGGGRREKGRERIDRYSITRSRAVETRGGGRREFKPL